MDDAEREIQRGMKRARHHDAIEDYLEEYTGILREFEAENTIEGDSDIAMVATNGPPWYDSKTRKLLDPEKVKIGMDKGRG
eukprot:16268166-Heterocapsa_arctica.AAC.1